MFFDGVRHYGNMGSRRQPWGAAIDIAPRDERCATTADCCPPDPGRLANTCIAGSCAIVTKVM